FSACADRTETRIRRAQHSPRTALGRVHGHADLMDVPDRRESRRQVGNAEFCATYPVTQIPARLATFRSNSVLHRILNSAAPMPTAPTSTTTTTSVEANDGPAAARGPGKDGTSELTAVASDVGARVGDGLAAVAAVGLGEVVGVALTVAVGDAVGVLVVAGV